MLLLAWAVLLAPQISLVHTLSHLVSHQTSSRSDEERQKAPDKVCDTCLVLAQIGTALPSHYEWQSQAHAPAESPIVTLHSVSLPPATAFLARAPPSALI